MILFLRKNLPILFFFIFSLVFTIIWFRNGNIMGAGESGLPFYNLNQNAATSVWAWGNQALGNVNSLTVAAGPYYFVLAFFQNLGVPGVFLQALFCFLILFFSLFSIYKLTEILFPDLNNYFKTFASFFYLFNLYSLMNIWNRNLHNTMLFYALIPLLIFYFIKGIKEKRLIYTLHISILTAIFSFAFGAPAQSLLFWILILVVGFFYFLTTQKKLFILKFFFINLGLWFILNTWWILQEIYFRFSHGYQVSAESFFTDFGNKNTFDTLSQVLGQTRNLFLMAHGTFFRDKNGLPYEWPLFYDHPFSLLIQWLVILLILFFAVKKIKNKSVGLFLYLFIVGIFAAKGNSAPLGEIFNFLFEKVSVLQFFRNPFEKLALFLPLALSPLFALMVSQTTNYFNKRFLGYLINGLFLLYIFVFMGFPFWSSLVFSSGNPPANDPKIGYEVEVPNYYSQANNYFLSMNDIFRVIFFPLGGEGIFYKWPKGYSGVELTGTLLQVPAISYNTTIPYYAEVVKKLEKIFLSGENFPEIAGLLNIEYVIPRPDLNQEISGMRDTQTIIKNLNQQTSTSSASLKLTQSFGDLKIYQIDPSRTSPRIYPAKNIIETNKLGDLEDFIIGDGTKGDIFITDKKLLEKTQETPKTTLIHSFTNFEYQGPRKFKVSEEPTIVPHTEYIPTDLLYPLILIKEKISYFQMLSPERKAENSLMLLGKRLVEAKRSSEKENKPALLKSIKLYETTLPKVIKEIKVIPPATTDKSGVWRTDFIWEVFGTHIILIDELIKKYQSDPETLAVLNKTRNQIYQELSAIKIFPLFELLSNKDFEISNRFIYQYDISKSGLYEIILPEKTLEKYFEMPGEIYVQFDNSIEKRPLKRDKKGYFNLGEKFFSKGKHEIGFNLPKPINLIEKQGEFLIYAHSDQDKSEKQFQINNFDPYSTYTINLDYYVKSGLPPTISLLQNNDLFKNGVKKAPVVRSKDLYADGYWFDYRKDTINFKPDPTADSAVVNFELKPWNDCIYLFKDYPEKCLDKDLKKRFDRTSEVKINNLEVTKSFVEDPILKMTEPAEEKPLPEISFNRINHTKYEVYIKNASEPFLLIFSELFDTQWRAFIKDHQENLFKDHYLVNGYANGWLIDKPGSYSLILDFYPQKILVIGYIISGISILGAIIILIILSLRKKK